MDITIIVKRINIGATSFGHGVSRMSEDRHCRCRRVTRFAVGTVRVMQRKWRRIVPEWSFADSSGYHS